MPVRSDPIIIGKDGEPIDHFPCWEIHHPWRVVLTNPEMKNRGKTFATYTEAKAFRKSLLKKYPPEREYEVTIVSRQIGWGPPSKITDEMLVAKNSHGELWCPYCRKFREFYWSPRWQVEKCLICRISTEDFHVRKNNPRFWSA